VSCQVTKGRYEGPAREKRTEKLEKGGQVLKMSHRAIHSRGGEKSPAPGEVTVTSESQNGNDPKKNGKKARLTGNIH